MNKLTKIVLSFLMVITCINFSTVQAEDGEEVNYSEPTTVETVSEDPANEVEQETALEEPAVEEEATVEEAPAEQPAEEAAPVEEPQQEEVAPEASEEAQVEDVNNAPEEATVAAEPQQEETTVAPEESQEEAKEEPAEVQKATVEISYVDEEEKEIADKVSDKEFDVDFVVTADDKEVYKDIDGYTFKEAIVNDDADNRTFTADTIKLDGLKVTSDMNKVKLVYSKNPVATKKDTTVKKTSKKSSGLLGALENAVDTLTGKTEEASDDADPLSVASTAVTVNVNRTTKLTGKGSWYSDHTWSTDNNDVVKITEENGREATIKGINPGTATVTHTYGNGSVDTWTVTVPTVGTVNASVFFLNDPNEDAGSNGTGMWYPSNGESNLTAVLDLTNAKFNGEKNLFNVESYVVSWPDGSIGPSWILPTTNAYWDLTFNAYKKKVESQLGVSIKKSDVTKIVLHPYKISDNTSGYHLDCNVEVVCEKVITVAFKVKDVNSDIFVNVSSNNYKTVKNGDVSIQEFSQPATKKDDNGRSYTFQGWYTDENCTNLVTEWPTKTKVNVNYYGKYVGNYSVSYDANDGTFAEGTTSPSTQLEGAQFTLAAAPTREGYTFQGWKLDDTNYDAGTTYTMPARDITFVAQWTSIKIEDYVTLNPTDVEETYDGTAKAAGKATASDSNNNDLKIEYQKADGSWTENPAEITATDVADSKQVEVRVSSEGNYEGYAYCTEKLTIKKRDITLTGSGWESTQPYTGQEYSKTDYTSDVLSGQTVVTTYEIKGKNVGTYTGTFGNEFKIMADEKDVTENYNTPTRNPGKLVISKAEITKYVTLNPTDVEETYDGTAKAAGKATASDSNNNDLKIEYQKADGSWTENPAEITATDVADSKQVEVRVSSEGNYEGYAYCTEKLTIKKRDITLTGSGWESTQPYTGQEYSKTDYTSEEANTANTRGLVSGQIVEATYELKGINVGEYTGEFKNITIKSVKGLFGLNVENTTSNYSISTEVGELQISRRNVTLTSDSSKKPYDGTALTNKNVIVSGDGFAEGEGAKFAVTGTITNVGTKVNTFGYTLNDNTLASNYNISTELGTLTITPKSIIPDGPKTPEDKKTGITVENPKDVKYDGKDHAEKPIVKDEKTGVTLEEGKDYEIVYPTDIRDAGTVTATVNGKGNYNGSFEIKYNILKRDVTLTSATDSKQYDGTALTNGNVEITGDGFVESEGATFNVTGSITDAGSAKNTFTYELNEGTLVSNYNITTKVGTLTITPKSIEQDKPETPDEKKNGIEVTKPEDSKYDGTEHVNKLIVTDTKTGTTLTEGTDYTLTYSEDVTNAGTVTVTITGKGNYKGSRETSYAITKRDVVLTSATDSKPYDGTALRNENVEVTGEGFAEGEGATYSEFAEVTNVTDEAVANTFTYTLNDNTLASNYNISTELGTLTITPKSIIPDGPVTPEEEKTGITVENPGDVKYDGKDHAEKPVIKDEKTGVTLEEGKDYEIVYPEDIKNAGEITATVVGKGDYEGSFEIKYNITKRDVTFTSATDSKQYDGNALTNGNVEITGDGFIEGEGATFNVTGSITDVGSTNNTFTYAMNEGTNADNYNVTVVEGTLTVSEQPVVPTPVTPTTPSNNTPARTNNVPARAVTQPTTTTPAPEATVEPEKAETTPAPTAKPEKIKEEATPQAAPKGHWALINLIAAMLSVVLAVVALLAKHAKDEDEDDEDKDDQVVANENEDDDENESTRHRRWKVIATIDAILAVVVFILTENISLPMVLVDKWTLLMVLFGLISIVSTYFARKWHEEDEDEDEESSQNA